MKRVAVEETNVDKVFNGKLQRILRSKSKKIIKTRKSSPRIHVVNEYKLKLRQIGRNAIENIPKHPSKSKVRKVVERPKKVRTNSHKKPKKNEIIELKPEQTISFNDLSLNDKIGGGGFGDVHVAIWKGQKVAVKKLRLFRIPQPKKKQFEDEVRIHAALDHPNIVKFYGACLVTPNLALVMEYLPDGSLHENLYKLKLKFKDKVTNQFICDCLSALKYMHSMDMVHRDIKSRNVMLYDRKRRCKLADFDTVLKNETEINGSIKHYNFAGTEKYCPKELLEGKRFTIEELKSADVYSMALMIFELLTKKEALLHCRNIRQIRDAIANDEILKTLERKECEISKAKKDLLKSALSSPKNRPSAVEFLTRFNQIIAAKI